MDDIDFLGYIVRPDYLLVRRRVVGALRDRLKRAEQSLAGVGMALDAHGRSLFPWHRRAVDETLQWLNSYLAHMKRASSHRLVKTLRDRFWWLEEYFVWDGSKVSLRYPIPRFTLRSWQQRRWFRDRFPGHVLMIQKGGFWEMDVLSRGTGPVPCPMAQKDPPAGLGRGQGRFVGGQGSGGMDRRDRKARERYFGTRPYVPLGLPVRCHRMRECFWRVGQGLFVKQTGSISLGGKTT